MKFKNFIVKDEEIIGVRIEDNGMLHDILYSKLTGITQLELMNLGLLRGINYRNNILTLGELKSSTKIHKSEHAVEAVDKIFEIPFTYTDITQDFKRSIEYDMYDWYYNYPDKVLYIEGARQTGKTYSVKKFIKENWGGSDGVFILNLMEAGVQEKLKEFYNRPIESIRKDAHCSSTAEGFAGYYFGNFDINTAKVLYIDEIQEDAGIYNTIREFARECKCRLIVSGSYLNIVSEAMLGNNIFKPPAGGDYRITMRSLSFIEFLQANGIINSQVLFKSAGEYSNDDNILFDKIQNLYHVYLKIGGYPEVVKEYINSHSIDAAADVMENLIAGYFLESKPYLSKCSPMIEFESTFISLLEIMTNTNSRHKIKDIAVEVKNVLKRNGKSINEADICNTLSWLESGGFLASVRKYRSIDLTNYAGAQKYFFYDLGVLNYIASLSAIPESTVNGYLAENFAFLQILDASPKALKTIGSLELQNDKVLGNLELDFVYKDKNKGCFAGVEVKYKNSSAKSLNKIKGTNRIKSLVKVINNKTDIRSGTIPIFCLRFYCMLDEFHTVLPDI